MSDTRAQRSSNSSLAASRPEELRGGATNVAGAAAAERHSDAHALESSTGLCVERISIPADGALHSCNAVIPVTLVKRRREHDIRSGEDLSPLGAAAQSTAANVDATSESAMPQQAQKASACQSGSAGGSEERLPVVIWLHATGASADAMLPRLQAFALLGFLAVAIDCRYHGERSTRESREGSRAGYQDAVYRAWRDGEERPFLLDNVRDLQRLLDFLQSRADVDPTRIGMTGVSLGGMHTWLCAALDDRIAAAAPMIGVQSFGWALRNEWYHGRVDSLRRAFSQICANLGKDHVDKDVVASAWQRLLPGLVDTYDSHLSLPCIAPRPLLIVNGADDPRCPVQGLLAPVAACRAAYNAHGAAAHFACHIEPGAGHQVTDHMDCGVEEFFLRALRPAGWQATLDKLGCARSDSSLQWRWWRQWPRLHHRWRRNQTRDVRTCDLHLDGSMAGLKHVLGGQQKTNSGTRESDIEGQRSALLRTSLRRPSHHLYSAAMQESATPV